MSHRDLCFQVRAEALSHLGDVGVRQGGIGTHETGAWRISCSSDSPMPGKGHSHMNAKYLRAITFTLGACLVLGGLGAFRMGRRSAQVESAPSQFKDVDDYITARMETSHIPGLSVAIVQGDQIVYLKGYGQAD